MPDVRTFRAASMREALEAVRADLGADAVILKTRQLPAKRKLFGVRRPADEYEITAGLGVEPTRKTKATPSRLPREDRPAPPPLLDPAPPASSGPAMTVSQRKAAEIVRELTERGLPSPLTSPDALRDALDDMRPAVAAATTRHAPASSSPIADPDPNDLLAARLDVLGRQIERLERAGRDATPADVPAPLRDLHARLIDAEVEPAVAADLIASVTPTPDAPALLADAVGDELSCAGELPVGSPGRPYVAALVGPTGVGKTTTVAKLAARYAFERKHRVGLVTVDTQRVGAIDQLRSYAEVMRLPLEVVPDAAAMPAALDRLSGCDLVLVDTAGRSPRDAAGIRRLAGVLAAGEIDETILAVSLASSLRATSAAVARFASLTPASLVVTKLDEAGGLGPLLSLAREARLPFRYVTDGQDVPGDIAAADPARLAADLLGRSDAPALIGGRS